MRNATLHEQLKAWVQEAGKALATEAQAADVPFEVLEEPGSGGRTPLYCYRPLTGPFIAERGELVLRVASAIGARRALERLDGLERYLRRRGASVPDDPHTRAEAALRALLAATYADTADFVFSAARYARAHAELEDALYAGRTVATVIVPVHGLALESEEVALGDGLRLVRGDALGDAPAEAVWAGEDEPRVLAVLEREEKPGEPAAVSVARARFRALLTALRLWDAGRFALDPVAWARTDGGPWRVLGLGASGRTASVVVVPAPHEDELRAFCSLVGRRAPRRGEVAWALARYEMGCERRTPGEALTDHLLALRALLEPEGHATGHLPQRVAALCAQPADRAALAERIAHAAALERATVAGLAPPDAPVDALVEEIARHLRALLRDTLCGHLDSDLRTLADQLLAEAVAA
jgi:hypothetical protein